MVITPIPKAIRGRSACAGLSGILIRLTGWNPRRGWCDATYAFYGGTKWILADALPVRMGLQLPKIIGDPARRGI